MTESTSEYHRRRAAEELAQAAIHRDDITAEQHQRLAKEHLLLAREAEKAARPAPGGGNDTPLRSFEAGT